MRCNIVNAGIPSANNNGKEKAALFILAVVAISLAQSAVVGASILLIVAF